MHTRSARWTLATTLIFTILFILALVARPHLDLWPSTKDWTAFTFADDGAGGSSRVLDFRNDTKVLAASFQVSNDLNRYAGVGFRLKSQQLSDITKYSHFHIKYRTPVTTDPLYVQLTLDVTGFTKRDDWDSARYMYANLAPSEGWTAVSIPFSEFQTPSWWYRINHLTSKSKDPADLSRLLYLGIAISEHTPAWKPQSVNIQSASLEGSWMFVMLTGALIPLPALLFLLGHYRNRIRLARLISPFAMPLEVGTQDEADCQRIIQLIAARYPDPELSLSSIHRDTGIPEARISPILEKRTGLKFKPYLNQVRIQEAVRLLPEDRQSIGEIAFLVGYSHVTHFNRVFRELMKVPPGEFRRSQGKGPV